MRRFRVTVELPAESLSAARSRMQYEVQRFNASAQVVSCQEIDPFDQAPIEEMPLFGVSTETFKDVQLTPNEQSELDETATL